jgi:hypothetical protein
MAYVGQLLLQSTQSIKDEIMNAKGYTTWCKVSRKALTERLPQPPPTKFALPVDLEPEPAAEASEENDEDEDTVEEQSDEQPDEGNFDQAPEEEYEVTAPPVFDPSSFNEEYDAKNNESRLLSDLKVASQVLHPKKL